MAALRSENGNLMFPPATAAGYSADNWLLADGDARDVTAASDEGAFRCDNLGCIGTVKGKIVARVRHPAALEEDCRVAHIVIAPFTVGKKCRAARVIVDRKMLRSMDFPSAPRRSPQRAATGPGRDGTISSGE